MCKIKAAVEYGHKGIFFPVLNEAPVNTFTHDLHSFKCQFKNSLDPDFFSFKKHYPNWKHIENQQNHVKIPTLHSPNQSRLSVLFLALSQEGSPAHPGCAQPELEESPDFLSAGSGFQTGLLVLRHQ